jgi:hypothetical protein
MGGKSGASQKEEWRNPVVCGFQESEQSISKISLHVAYDGSYFTEGGGFLEDVNVRWILRIQSDYGAP